MTLCNVSFFIAWYTSGFFAIVWLSFDLPGKEVMSRSDIRIYSEWLSGKASDFLKVASSLEHHEATVFSA